MSANHVATAIPEDIEKLAWAGCVVSFYLPDPWCPAHSEVSEWHYQSSAAGAAVRHLWADRPPLCRRSLTETREKVKRAAWKEGRKESMRNTKQRLKRVHAFACMCLWSICKKMEQRLTYGIRGERVILKIFIPFVELFLHSVHEWLLWGETQEAEKTVYIQYCVLFMH